MRGHFADLNATRRHGGKTWIAPKVMIREDVSNPKYARIDMAESLHIEGITFP